MTEITIYRADDGTDFEDESECIEYEWGSKASKVHFTLLSHNHRILPTDRRDSYNDCFYVFVPNNVALKELRQVWDGDVVDSYLPDAFSEWDAQPGLYVYDEIGDEWYHLGTRIAELQDVADTAMKAINGA